MATYARGIHSVGQCGICGLPFPYTDLRRDGEVRGLLVCQACWDPKHPQETPAKPIDPIALRNPSPMSAKGIAEMVYPFYDVPAFSYFGSNMARFSIGQPTIYYGPPYFSDNLVVQGGDLTFRTNVAYCIGPTALQSSQQGLLEKAWRATATGSFIAVQRENEAGTGWGEIVYSTTALGEVQQVGIAFVQNGEPVLVYEANGRCYIYWFDATLGSLTTIDLGEGKTPVCVLDTFSTVPSDQTDVLVFWVASDGTVKWVQQRDRFTIAYDTPVSEGGDIIRLKCVGQLKNYRIRVSYTQDRELKALDTAPYPYGPVVEAEQHTPAFVFGELIQDGEYYLTPIEAEQHTPAFVFGQLNESLIPYVTPIEANQHTPAFVSGAFVTTLIQYTTPIEANRHTPAFVSGELVDKLVEYIAPIEANQHTPAFVSGELVTP